GTYSATPGGVDMSPGHTSAWNPAGAPGPGGQWNNHASGWEDIPFPPEGNIKLRYRYSVDLANQITFYVCGTFPGFGAPEFDCGSGMTGNYKYVETLIGTSTADTFPQELPSPGF